PSVGEGGVSSRGFASVASLSVAPGWPSGGGTVNSTSHAGQRNDRPPNRRAALPSCPQAGHWYGMTVWSRSSVIGGPVGRSGHRPSVRRGGGERDRLGPQLGDHNLHPRHHLDQPLPCPLGGGDGV